MTVGASDRSDFKAFYSPLGDPNSPNNQFLDIVAPSHRAYSHQLPGETWEVWSIDIPSSPGYNSVKRTDGGNLPVVGSILPNSGTNYLDYTARFGGTSASCPQVAAVAALMLSVNPNLTQQQVFDILTATADEVGGYAYVNGESDELGSGRLNAHSAVWQALGTTFSISGPSRVCTSQSTFTINNVPVGETVSWIVSRNLREVSQSNSTYTVYASNTATGWGWVRATISSPGRDAIVVQKSVKIGEASLDSPPNNDPRVEDLPEICRRNNLILDNIITAIGDNLDSSTEYEWEVLSNNFNYAIHENQIYLYPHTVGQISFRVRAGNECGWSSWVYYYYDVIDCGRSGALSVSPNPANTYMDVSISTDNKEEKQLRSTDNKIHVKLYNNRSMSVYNKTFYDKEFRINTSKLKQGLYLLEVIYNGERHTQQVLIE